MEMRENTGYLGKRAVGRGQWWTHEVIACPQSSQADVGQGTSETEGGGMGMGDGHTEERAVKGANRNFGQQKKLSGRGRKDQQQIGAAV